MKILVINAGSSSLKYQLIDMRTEEVLAKGICEKIGFNDSFLKHTKIGYDETEIKIDIPDHKTAMQEVVCILTDPEDGIISSITEISAVGHRIVHGGENFKGSTVINNNVMKAVRECIDIAPLHNPQNITGIEACMKIMPNTPMVGVFDTAFHQTMPEHAYMYALPYEYYKKYGIRRYGFHGTSHMYVAQRGAQLIQKPIETLKMITCHLGNGASVCAVNGGKSVDTSLGFTPLEGLVMGTRSGNIDPAIIKFLMEKEKMSISEVDHLLNTESGLLGITGISSDFRDIEAAAEGGNKRCLLAIEVYCYRIKQYIGAYIASMEGLDAIVFTAGIGENSATVRRKSLERLEYMGISINSEKNKISGKEMDISKHDSKVRILVIPTNEELMIARETSKLLV